MFSNLSESYAPVCLIKGINEICLKEKFVPCVLHHLPSSMDHRLGASSDPNTDLERGQEGSSLTSHRNSSTFGGETPEQVANCNWSNTSVLLLASIESRSTQVRGDPRRNLASEHSVGEPGEGFQGTVSSGDGREERGSQVFRSKPTWTRGRALSEPGCCFQYCFSGERKRSSVGGGLLVFFSCPFVHYLFIVSIQ